jgi:glycosyltransferase involved in cell wall biosynthesis
MGGRGKCTFAAPEQVDWTTISRQSAAVKQEGCRMARLGVVVKGYPRLSETFIAQEIRALERRGIEQVIVSLCHPRSPFLHPVHRQISAEVLYLPEFLKDDPVGVREARRWAEDQPRFSLAWQAFQADLNRDPSPGRWRRLGQACVLARDLPQDVDWVHTHYLHAPASVTRYAALIRDLPWSFSAHAKDIWTIGEWELRLKLAEAEWGVTCSRYNFAQLRSFASRPERLHLIYHGLDQAEIPAAPDRTGRDGPAVTIVSVGRAVEKKGYDDLLRALHLIRADRRWTFHHIGDGLLIDRLKERAVHLGLGDRIVWHGARERGAVFDLLEGADLFVLPCRIARTGDRDGLPNVLMEAQALGLPVVSTTVAAVPELIEHGRNGWLVPQKSPSALAAALTRLMDDPALRARLGAAAAVNVRERFSAEPNFDRLATLIARSRAPSEADRLVAAE